VTAEPNTGTPAENRLHAIGRLAFVVSSLYIPCGVTLGGGAKTKQRTPEQRQNIVPPLSEHPAINLFMCNLFLCLGPSFEGNSP
jgi:hypothetical protein